MIPLNVQLKMITFSFSYGFIFFIVLKLLKSLIYNKNIFRKIIISLLFGITNGVLYFFFLKQINDGILNINLLFTFVFGMYICKVLLEKKKRIIYN